MTWSVTLSGHIGSRETERDLVEGLRSVVNSLNNEGTRYVSHARLTTSHHGVIDLLEARTDEFQYATPITGSGAIVRDAETTSVKDTDKMIVGNEVLQKPEENEDEKEEGDEDEK